MRSSTMRPSASLLRTLSLKLISSAKLSPSPVAPWPPLRSAFDRWLSSELDELRFTLPGRCTTALWLCQALDLAVAAQDTAAKLLASAASPAASDYRKLVDDCLDDVVELLDACNGLRERVEDIKKYAGSISTAARYLQGWRHERSEAPSRRATAALAKCEAMERGCAELDKCGSSLRRLGEKMSSAVCCSPPRPCNGTSTDLCEALCGSRAATLLVVAANACAIAFRTRRGLPAVQPSSKGAAWGGKLQELHRELKEEFEKRKRGGVVVLDELDAAAASARCLRQAIARRDIREMRVSVDLARRRGRELEERVRPVGEKVDQLYRQLIIIRVSLLEKLTEL